MMNKMSVNNLIEFESEVVTKTVFSKNKKDRYLLKTTWDKSKKSLAIIMTFPSSADELIFDQTTMLVRNQAVNNGFGSVSIVNLFSSVNNESPKLDKTNSSIVMKECDSADMILVAYGRKVGYEKEKEILLRALYEQFEKKLYTIVDTKGLPFSHPLSPLAHKWNIQKICLD